MQLVGAHHITADGLDQRLHQMAGFTDPSRQDRTIQFDAFPGVDLRLPVKWDVVGILGCDHVCQHPRTGKTAFDGARGRRSLHY